jgi:hypothetical protein
MVLKLYFFGVNIELRSTQGGVGSNMHFHYCPCTGSIKKPSLQCFHILSCSVAFKVPFSSISKSAHFMERENLFEGMFE